MTTTTKVYKYGAKLDPETADIVREQIDLAWAYRNTLVALEIERRAEADRIVSDAEPRISEIEKEIETAENDLEAIREAIRRINSATRTRDPDPGRRAAARDLRARLKELRAERKALRKETFARSDVRAALDGLDARHKERHKAERAKCGVFWGTYLTIEAGLRGIRAGAPPRFIRRNDWPGKIAVQIQGGLSWGELLSSTGGQAKVERLPLPPNAKPGGRRSKRPWHRLYLRVGSEGRTPVWATARFALHRPIPHDARVKWIYLVRERAGTQYHWSVQFVLTRDAWPFQDTTEARGACGVDMGWRMMSDGSMRVAYAVGSDGIHSELSIPAHVLARETKASDLQEIRDRNFNVARDGLAHWLSTADVPDWFREQTRTVAQWRSQARLAALVLRWRVNRFGGDAERFEKLEAWRKQDEHLYLWQAHSRRSFRLWRQDAYRRFAARLRWRYETVIVEDTDWRTLLRKPEAEDDMGEMERRRYARMASPGLLRETLESGHPSVIRGKSENTTRACSICGSDPASDWDSARELDYRCASGHQIDQDENAALNLLASGEVVHDSGAPVETGA